jgi:hypothetical protein
MGRNRMHLWWSSKWNSPEAGVPDREILGAGVAAEHSLAATIMPPGGGMPPTFCMRLVTAEPLQTCRAPLSIKQMSFLPPPAFFRNFSRFSRVYIDKR